MTASVASLLAPSSKIFRSLRANGRRRARGGGSTSRQLWLATVAGSVALLLLAARRQRARAVPAVQAGTDTEADPSPAEPTADSDIATYQVDPYPVEVPSPTVHRATLAITLGKPAELRLVARDLQRAGQDAESGLLENYALLLERSSTCRSRVLAEVTRMLRSSAAERSGRAAY